MILRKYFKYKFFKFLYLAFVELSKTRTLKIEDLSKSNSVKVASVQLKQKKLRNNRTRKKQKERSKISFLKTVEFTHIIRHQTLLPVYHIFTALFLKNKMNEKKNKCGLWGLSPILDGAWLKVKPLNKWRNVAFLSREQFGKLFKKILGRIFCLSTKTISTSENTEKFGISLWRNAQNKLLHIFYKLFSSLAVWRKFFSVLTYYQTPKKNFRRRSNAVSSFATRSRAARREISWSRTWRSTCGAHA